MDGSDAHQSILGGFISLVVLSCVILASYSFIEGYFTNEVVSIVQRNELLQETKKLHLIRDKIFPAFVIIDRSNFQPIL